VRSRLETSLGRNQSGFGVIEAGSTCISSTALGLYISHCGAGRLFNPDTTVVGTGGGTGCVAVAEATVVVGRVLLSPGVDATTVIPPSLLTAAGGGLLKTEALCCGCVEGRAGNGTAFDGGATGRTTAAAAVAGAAAGGTGTAAVAIVAFPTTDGCITTCGLGAGFVAVAVTVTAAVANVAAGGTTGAFLPWELTGGREGAVEVVAAATTGWGAMTTAGLEVDVVATTVAAKDCCCCCCCCCCNDETTPTCAGGGC
jgi:hypothetical protein